MESEILAFEAFFLGKWTLAYDLATMPATHFHRSPINLRSRTKKNKETALSLSSLWPPVKRKDVVFEISTPSKETQRTCRNDGRQLKNSEITGNCADEGKSVMSAKAQSKRCLNTRSNRNVEELQTRPLNEIAEKQSTVQSVMNGVENKGSLTQDTQISRSRGSKRTADATETKECRTRREPTGRSAPFRDITNNAEPHLQNKGKTEANAVKRKIGGSKIGRNDVHKPEKIEPNSKNISRQKNCRLNGSKEDSSAQYARKCQDGGSTETDADPTRKRRKLRKETDFSSAGGDACKENKIRARKSEKEKEDRRCLERKTEPAELGNRARRKNCRLCENEEEASVKAKKNSQDCDGTDTDANPPTKLRKQKKICYTMNSSREEKEDKRDKTWMISDSDCCGELDSRKNKTSINARHKKNTARKVSQKQINKNKGEEKRSVTQKKNQEEKNTTSRLKPEAKEKRHGDDSEAPTTRVDPGEDNLATEKTTKRTKRSSAAESKEAEKLGTPPTGEQSGSFCLGSSSEDGDDKEDITWDLNEKKKRTRKVPGKTARNTAVAGKKGRTRKPDTQSKENDKGLVDKNSEETKGVKGRRQKNKTITATTNKSSEDDPTEDKDSGRPKSGKKQEEDNKDEECVVTAKPGTLKYLKQRDNFIKAKAREVEVDEDFFSDDAVMFTKKYKVLGNLLAPSSGGDDSLIIKTPKSKTVTAPDHVITPRTALLGQLGAQAITPSTKSSSSVSPYTSSPAHSSGSADAHRKDVLEVMFHQMQGEKGQKRGIRKVVEESGAAAGSSNVGKPNASTLLQLPTFGDVPDINEKENDSSHDEYFDDSFGP